MVIAIVLIICITVLLSVYIVSVFNNSTDSFTINKRLKDIEYSLDDLREKIDKAAIKLENVPDECEVKISENFPKMTYQFEIHFTDLRFRSEEGRIKRIAEEVERHLHDEV